MLWRRWVWALWFVPSTARELVADESDFYSYVSIPINDTTLLACFLTCHHLRAYIPIGLPAPCTTATLRPRVTPTMKPRTQQVSNSILLHQLCNSFAMLILPWQIAIPNWMLTNIICWYYQVLNHIGITQLVATLEVVHFYHPRLWEQAQVIVSTCNACQHYKLTGTPSVGELLPQDANAVPWDKVAIKFISPW